MGAAPYLTGELARFVDALARGERRLAGKPTDFVCGLWTEAHGFVHTGHVCASLAWSSNRVSVTATAEHNVLPFGDANRGWRGPASGR